MKDEPIYVLRALSLGLCPRRVSILLLLSQEELGVMSLTRATGQYRQLISNDLRALLAQKMVTKVSGTGRIKVYRTSEAGVRVLGALKIPLELAPVGE